MTRSAAAWAATIGRTAREISFMEMRAIPQATKRLTPTGGVIWPIAMFTVITIPKWTRSIPRALTTGRRIGRRM